MKLHTVAIKPEGITQGLDARDLSPVIRPLHTLITALLPLMAALIAVHLINASPEYLTFKESSLNLLQLIIGNPVPYGRQELISAGLWIAMLYSLLMSTAKVLDALDGFRAEVRASKLLSRWLMYQGNPRAELFVPDAEARQETTQVIAMAYHRASDGERTLEVFCLDAARQPMLIICALNFGEYMEVRRIRRGDMIRYALNANFPRHSSAFSAEMGL